jgi:serine phosphatase RsbU (regulator of sigma subunit)
MTSGMGQTRSDQVFRVLLLEDDDGDALLVEELLLDAEESLSLIRATSIAEALPLMHQVDCALVDLGLPDALGLTALQRLEETAPGVALVVLTGNTDRERGLAALALGAQDYLVKGEVDGRTIARSVRYAVERRRAKASEVALLLAGRRQAENDRLARGLLPRLEVGGRGVETRTRYQPGGREALLGGDFFDAIQLDDGTVRAIIGDICGHGPDEAALGVALRIAWRTSVLLGAPAETVMLGMDNVLRHERDLADLFATVCDVTIDPTGTRGLVRLHGHPPPLQVSPNVGWMHVGPPAPPLGVGTYRPAPTAAISLEPPWALVLLTDGLHEARHGAGRLEMEGLADIASTIDGWQQHPSGALDELVERVTDVNGADLDDDVALLWLGSTGLAE